MRHDLGRGSCPVRVSRAAPFPGLVSLDEISASVHGGAMRNRKHPLETVAEWFQALGVDFVAAAQAAGQDTAKLIQAFEDCRARAKANFKRLAFERHPDRVPEGKRAEAEESFKSLSAAWEALQRVEMKPRPRQPAFSFVATSIVIYHGGMQYQQARYGSQWPYTGSSTGDW